MSFKKIIVFFSTHTTDTKSVYGDTWQMHLPGTEKSTATTLSNEADYIKAHIGATTH